MIGRERVESKKSWEIGLKMIKTEPLIKVFVKKKNIK